MSNSKSIQVIELIDNDFSDTERDEKKHQIPNQEMRSGKKRRRQEQDILDYLYGEAECTDSDDEMEDEDHASDADSNGNLKDFVVDDTISDLLTTEYDSDSEDLDFLVDDFDDDKKICTTKRKLIDCITSAIDDAIEEEDFELEEQPTKKTKYLIKPNIKYCNNSKIHKIEPTTSEDEYETLSD